MIKFYENTSIIKQVYTFDNYPIDNYDYVKNIGYKLGSCTWNNDTFTPYLNKLIKEKVIIKVYDIIQNGQREAIYEFSNGKGEIEFFGENYMSYILNYNF